jgi:GDPmannose 4,6-dehydratase
MMLNQEKYNSALKCRLNKYKAMSTSPIKEEQITAWLSQKIQEYVLSSNETHKIREFVEEAFNFAGFAKDQCRWQGKDLEEKYIHEDKVLVKINPEFYRPAEVEILYGDSSRARNELGWQPKTNFLSLVEKMVRNDLKKD